MHRAPLIRAPFIRAITGSLLALCLALPASADPAAWRHEWPNTDFSITTVAAWSEILSGGPPKDGIPALDAPSFLAVADETRLGAREPVVTVELDGATPRAYPIRYLTWHEIVNDSVAGIPIAVTFCPLCNSAPTFDRRVGETVLEFGVSGKLRNSDMVMYDRQTESWWQQALGQGIVGHYTGETLTQLPTWMESWEEFSTRNPDGLVMDEPGYARSYGRNPYVSYDSSTRPFLYAGELPPHDIPALARVVRVEDAAWPVARLREAGEITENDVTLSWAAGQASALDAPSIAQGKDVGTIRVRDGSGRDLPHDVMFAFAFHAFFPQGEWMIE
ncbi:MAG: DUF3179 domain-containing protein [Pseudomonadota bacterium]